MDYRRFTLKNLSNDTLHLGRCDLRRLSYCLLEVPRTRTKTYMYGERRFDKAAAVLWNSIPDRLRKADPTLTFKKALKTHLYIQAYYL